MKSYRTGTSFHMVGQAWQIRIMLKQWMKETEPHAPLATLLGGETVSRQTNRVSR